MSTIQVHLGARSYPIHIERGLIDRAGEYFLSVFGQCAAAVVTDDNVAPLYLDRVMTSLAQAGIRAVSITLPHGERTKCLDCLTQLYTFFSEHHITRKDVVIALGGGVMGDLAGLAAATWLRGVRLMQMPTTLLAQVDSSVGGKVAVDLPQGKNLVGAFWQPSLVLADPDTLQTLTSAYWRDGLGEVVKYGCIGDEPLFRLLEKDAPMGREGLMQDIDEILCRCISYKANVVEQDEHDTGLRMTLNFGHTLAHAVETVQHYEGYRHGEAVAIGMAAITRLSEERGLTDSGTAQRLIALEKALSLPTELPEIPKEDLLHAMTQDKKNAGDTLTVILLRRIGNCYLHKTTTAFFRD